MSKKIIILGILCMFFVAFVAFFGGTYVMHKTGDDKFCNTCHSWMDPMTQTYLSGSHGGNNPSGVKASCVSCHLPHDDSKLHYTFKKALNGITEISYMLVNSPEDMDWETNRKNREKYVFDSGCLSCHANITQANTKNEGAKFMHEQYLKSQKSNDKEKLTCVSCHKNIGHEDLEKVLYDRKNPPIGNWDTDDNASVKK